MVARRGVAQALKRDYRRQCKYDDINADVLHGELIINVAITVNGAFEAPVRRTNAFKPNPLRGPA